ncbi:ribokinase [Candidatus Gottesmanbacteria bacterium]|nr:ribokinase [Candidatus Gottesmanbacteria bacterium]
MTERKNVPIQVVGSINMDLITKVPRFPGEGETITGVDFFTAPGGKGANQAVAAARLGAKTAMIGCVGIDRFGKELVASLQREKVSMRRINFIPDTPTGTAMIIVNEKAQNQIIVIPGANHKITEEHLAYSWNTLQIKPQALLLQLEIPLPIVIKAAQLAKKGNTMVVLNPAPAPITFLPAELLNHVDFLIPNEHEAKILAGTDDLETAADQLRNKGPKVIITLGDKGAMFFDDKPVYVDPFRVNAIDPTAAGDAFVAAFTVATLQGQPILGAIRFANAAGALAATKIGAQPSLPTFAEVKRFIASC